MDTRVELLEAFYQTMRKDKIKIENKNYGFDFINQLTANDAMLDYGQMENNFIHKYRLLNVSEQLRERLLQGHVNQEYNVCLYFDETANNTLCFNLDNNFKTNNTQLISEMKLAVDYLQQHLGKYGIETVCIKSGRGYHQWCHFERPIANRLLLNFMIRIAAKTLASLHYSNHDYHTIKINMSPNPKFVNVLSLRAFGSRHIKTGNFSHIQTKDGVLNEEDSWKYFSDYMINKTISEQQFMLAYDDLAKTIVF
ncbi:hypothetical protein Ga0466249_003688 [Sporomusaceae bacterium BoRhaA]|uniref:hypothetical protein n=1 Tax=Pelorhabdus rhamnosifermentans TaxID=2772457 RepID=UPI001C060DA2|nr:hypothetical protein [Pelorhabdus rhamnosifermentans]MBU2702554.1 hypothetical protein [Pelorhabdus rhamnosifermentans]